MVCVVNPEGVGRLAGGGDDDGPERERSPWGKPAVVRGYKSLQFVIKSLSDNAPQKAHVSPCGEGYGDTLTRSLPGRIVFEKVLERCEKC